MTHAKISEETALIWEVWQKAAREGEVNITCNSREERERLRLNFYNAVKLRNAPEEAKQARGVCELRTVGDLGIRVVTKTGQPTVLALQTALGRGVESVSEIDLMGSAERLFGGSQPPPATIPVIENPTENPLVTTPILSVVSPALASSSIVATVSECEPDLVELTGLIEPAIPVLKHSSTPAELAQEKLNHSQIPPVATERPLPPILSPADSEESYKNLLAKLHLTTQR